MSTCTLIGALATFSACLLVAKKWRVIRINLRQINFLEALQMVRISWEIDAADEKVRLLVTELVS